MKLICLLNLDELGSYEKIRFDNIYKVMFETNQWEGIEDKTPKRGHETTEEESTVTPTGRHTFLKNWGLHTPSPIMKKTKITEFEMKSLSVAVHLWADRKKGGVKFLHSVRLTEDHFRDILSYAGPDSKWNIIKGWTVKKMKNLWKNNYGGSASYRGHKTTGFQNKNGMHQPTIDFCPFSHCDSGLLSPMDIDLMILTPEKRKTDNKILSRNLFPDQESSSSTKDKLAGCGNDKDDESKAFEEELNLVKNSSEVLIQSTNISNELEKLPADQNVESTEHAFGCPKCSKVFKSFDGLKRHFKIIHSDEDFEKPESYCNICKKRVSYLIQHIRVMHSERVKAQFCDICLQEININMKLHRKTCIKCIYCSYENPRKQRLLAHIEKCPENKEQEPMDLRTPEKIINDKRKSQNDCPLDLKSLEEEKNSEKESQIGDPLNLQKYPSFDSIVLGRGKEKNKPKSSRTETYVSGENTSLVNKDSMEANQCETRKIDETFKKNKTKFDEKTFEKKRSRYPFDQNTIEEEYYSEFDCSDTEEFTIERRNNKDDIELQLRAIDEMKNPRNEGDVEIVEQFRTFMKNKHEKEGKNVKGEKKDAFSDQLQPSTIELYTKVYF